MRSARVIASVALAVAACRQPVATPVANPPRPSASQDAGTSVAAPAPKWPETRPRFVKEIASAKDGLSASAIGNEVLVARREENRFRVARLANDALVDEDAWSRGLRPPQKSNNEPTFPCSHIDAIFGRFPDRLWLVENAGGNHECRSTFGEYTIWRRQKGSWTKDTAHSASEQPAGIFATWPLGPTVLGVGVSNLVGDTLSLPEDAMMPLDADPWRTRRHLRHEGSNIESVCASATGVVEAISENGGKLTLETIRPDGSRSTVDVPPPHAPAGPCAVSEKETLFVQPPRAPEQRETWLSFEQKARAWTPIAVPWSYRTWRLDFFGARIIAWTAEAGGKKHVLLSKRDDVLEKHDSSAWTELVGLPDGDGEIEVVSMRDDELLLVIDRMKLIRVGLALQ